MFRLMTTATAALVLALAAPVTRADDWDDYRERQRERYEDWLEDQREARQDYFDRLGDQRDRRRGWYNRGLPPALNYYYPGPSYYGGPTFYPRYNYPRYNDYRPGGFSFRGPRGRGFSLRW